MPRTITKDHPYIQEMRDKIIRYCDKMPDEERAVLSDWLLTIRADRKKIESISISPTPMLGDIPEHIDRLRQRQIVVIEDGRAFASPFFANLVREFGFTMPTRKNGGR